MKSIDRARERERERERERGTVEALFEEDFSRGDGEEREEEE